ncbi:MAG TPA: DUF2085 domain-containing protein [Chloroflexi bacterium]|nr:DUF2085 domain-containing protein [Chloroflexota bacterium]
MAAESDMQSGKRKPKIALKILLVVFTGGLLLIWLITTPPGLLGKSDAVAYAVCHRISSHSFMIGDRPFSLCARCSGQYLGFLWGFGLQVLLGKKKSGFPSRWAAGVLVLLVLLYALDGLNSFFYLYPGLENWSLYLPNNPLRLFTGLGMGLAISGLYYPLMGQTIWKDYSLEKPLAGTREWLLWTGGGIGIGLLVLTGHPLILYSLILLSTGGLLVLLTLLYTMIWILLFRRENSFSSWGDLGWWILAGFGTASFQITLIDAVRYFLTGTW